MVHQITKILGLIIVFGLLLLNSGCYYDNEQELYPAGSCDTSAVTYSLVVSPIIQFNCYSCHSNSTAATSGNSIALEGHTNLSGYITTNQVKFVDAIQHTGIASPMPKNAAALSSCDVKKILTWIHAGMPNN